MLLPAEQGSVFKKSGYKQNMVWPCSINNGKVILVLIEKIITFYMGLTPVDVQKPGFYGEKLVQEPEK